MNSPPDPIEEYLRELRVVTRLRTNSERLVQDAEEHLRDAQLELIAQGLDPLVAAAAATSQFGAVGEIATASPRAGGPLGGQILRAGLPVVATGLIGIGLAGLIATVAATAVGADGTAALAGIQLALGFVGVSMLEARRRRVASGGDLATPGIEPAMIPKSAATGFAVLALVLFALGTILVVTGRHAHSTNVWLTGAGLAATSIWLVIAARRTAVVSSRPAGPTPTFR